MLCEVSGRPPRVHGACRCRARRPVCAAQLQPHRHPQARPPPRIPAGGDRRGARRRRRQKLGEREDLTHLADRRHRSRRRARPRRRHLGRAGRRRGQQGRLEGDRRHRRRQLLRAPRFRARPRGEGARQQRLLPRPRRADAAGGIVRRHLLAEGRARCGRRWPATSRSPRTASLKSWRFTRAKICVAANIAYEDAQAAIDAAGEERVEVSSPTCSMPDVEGAVPSELVRDGASAIVGRMARLARRPQQARTAGARHPRTPGDARREGPHHFDRRRATGSTRTGWSRIS